MQKGVEVSDDHILLSTICDERDITAKQLSMLTGRALSTVYKYLAGELTIPSVMWRSLYKLTLDVRIMLLLAGDVPIIIVPLIKQKCKNGNEDTPSLQELIEVRKKQIACESLVLKILADNRIDSADRIAVAKYRTEFALMIENQSQIFQAITHEFNVATAK